MVEEASPEMTGGNSQTMYYTAVGGVVTLLAILAIRRFFRKRSRSKGVSSGGASLMSKGQPKTASTTTAHKGNNENRDLRRRKHGRGNHLNTIAERTNSGASESAYLEVVDKAAAENETAGADNDDGDDDDDDDDDDGDDDDSSSFDEDDEQDDTSSSTLCDRFASLSNAMRNSDLDPLPSNSDLLSLYALYKVATYSDAELQKAMSAGGSGRPSMFNIEARMKWDAVQSLLSELVLPSAEGQKPPPPTTTQGDPVFVFVAANAKDKAMSKYCELASSLLHPVESAPGDVPKKKSSGSSDGQPIGRQQSMPSAVSINYTTTLSDILQHCIDGDADLVLDILRAAKAADESDLVKLLDARDPETGSSLMHYACDMADHKASASLVAELLSLDASTRSSSSSEGSSTVRGGGGLWQVERLFKFACAPDGEGVTPLHVAATVGNVDVVKLLLKGGADLYAVDGEGGSVMDAASGEEEVLKAIEEFRENREFAT